MKIPFAVLAVLAAGTVSAQQMDMRIVDEGKLDGAQVFAVAGNQVAPDYPAAYVASGDDVCIAMAYTIKPDGSTGDFKVLQAWSSDSSQAQSKVGYVDAFAAKVIDVVSKWRFVQQERTDAQPVSTVATLTFKGNGGTRRLGDRCRVSQLVNYYKTVGRADLRTAQELKRTADQVMNQIISVTVHQLYDEAYLRNH
ncbi:hypothetical protein [Thermomonas sp.]|uniref:hypothetical protein n=1 Tax=Thermomonas sp. TaxID=1971895 RepID=UPI0024894458|nr:hypothetical protein [Thermomonas sp.]MDI1251793.1 hypothetical protein [Thermomonas sp.]